MRAKGRALYLLFSAIATIFVARTFYGYMLRQTGGEWSAPLDDVFIHFDYARATAQGHPFEWSPGNGYSSGNTSVLYPFVLAAGYWMGFHGATLMVWAGIVACTSVFALLFASDKLFATEVAWAKYLAPIAIFAVGALDWSLFSGMEVALFLGVWSGAWLAATRMVEQEVATTPRSHPPWDPRRPTTSFLQRWQLGLWGAVLVVTRPEGVTSIAWLGVMVAVVTWRRRGYRAACASWARAVAPPVAMLVVQAIANRLLTGEFAASGSLVKLTLYNPYMTAREKFDEYAFLLKYVVFRNTEYHFADAMPYGYIVPLLAAVPLLFARTRLVALTLWGSIFSWLLIVALNAQVRWQNERYTMPAVAWLLLLAALGTAQLLSPPSRSSPLPRSVTWWLFGTRLAATATLLTLFALHQEPRLRDQIWFFGRASRNIRDQHTTAGRILREMKPRPRRVLVGDAGALLYASDLPGLDLIGLGGYHDLPFARAGVHGLGATLELIERIAPRDRPDVFAIYPSWWGDLPNWFGHRILEVPVRGNVICGGSEKVIYRADWYALDRGSEPKSAGPNARIVDELDVADLVSERQHHYEFPHPSAGFVDAKILADATSAQKELFDAGRRIPSGRSETFELSLEGVEGVRLVARTAPEHDVTVRVAVDGQPIGSFHFEHADGWRENTLALPRAYERVRITLTPESGDWVDHHIWAVTAP